MLASLLSMIGCAPPPLDDAATPEGELDPQACAENALRNNPDPVVARDAAAAFAERCGAHEVAGCAMLGLAYDLGVGMPKSPARARGLLTYACSNGNAHACGNLAALVFAEGASGPARAEAFRMLSVACEGRDARSCAALGRTAVAARTPDGLGTGARLLERACVFGDASACEPAADLVDRGVTQAGPARADALRSIACGRGDQAACRHAAERAADLANPRRGRLAER